jgi:hypothetical protein
MGTILVAGVIRMGKMRTFIKAGKFGNNPNKILYIRYDGPQWEGGCSVFLSGSYIEEPAEIILSAEDAKELKEYVDQHTIPLAS